MKSSYRAPALDRGLDILEKLSTVSSSQTLSELAKDLKRSPSEIFRVIGVLEQRGYVERHGLGYSSSLKLDTLVHTHSLVVHLRHTAGQPMQHLSALTGESCHLSILHDDEVLVVAYEESLAPVHLLIEVGARFPAFSTGSGRLLLANLHLNHLQAYLNTNSAYVKLRAERKATIQHELRSIKQNGYSVTYNDSSGGVRDLAVLVGNPQAGPMAALGVTSLAKTRKHLNLNTKLNLLRNCADILAARVESFMA